MGPNRQGGGWFTVFGLVYMNSEQLKGSVCILLELDFVYYH